MTLDDLTETIAWLAPEEHRAAADLIQSFQQYFGERQIPVTPILVLRIRDYLRHHFLSDRVESDLTPGTAPGVPVAAEPAPVAESQPATFSAVDHRLAEQVGRTQARQRRSLKDLEITINLLDATSPYRRAAARTLAKSQSAATNEASAEAKPYNPMHDPKYIQDIIEEVGIDLNDPEFFDDEDNFYDLPLKDQIRLRPESVPSHLRNGNIPSAPAITPAQTQAQFPDLPKQPNPAHNSTPTAPLSTDNHAQSTIDVQTRNQSLHESSATPPKQEALPEDEPLPSHDSHSPQNSQPTPRTVTPPSPLPTVNSPLSIAPDPPSPPPSPPWKSPIPPTPPPKVFIYQVKPTPFNQGHRKK